MSPSGVVAVCGAGRLGRRYLEGMLRSDRVAVIHVFDVLETALNECKQVVALSGSCPPSGTNPEVVTHRAIEGLPEVIDLAVVATTADVRPEVVSQISEHSQVGCWVLEKVLAQNQIGLSCIEEALSDSQVWVNMPRRMTDWYRRLNGLVGGMGPLLMTVEGGRWGMATNAVHFIDLVTWWSGETPQGLDISSLDPTWIPSKRPGFLELQGSLSVDFSLGSRLIMSSDQSPDRHKITIGVDATTWSIDEEAGLAERSDGLQEPGCQELQSEMTPSLVSSILGSGSCLLPPLNESVLVHRVFLNGLERHWKVSGGLGSQVPIT